MMMDQWFMLAAAALFVGVSARAGSPGVALKNPFFAMDTGTHLPGGTPEAQLDMVKELGYKGISWTLGDPAEARSVAEGARKRGLKLFALYAGATLRRGKLEYDPRLKDAMTALKGYDTLIWLHVGSSDYPKSSPEGDAAAVEGLRELADFAAARRLRIALYPHVGDWIERVQDAVRVAQAAGRRNLGATFNLCHCLQVGDEQAIPDLLARAAPHLFMVTVNGADTGAAGAGWDRLIQTLDRGTLDLAPLLRRLKELRYTGPIGLQGYGIPGDSQENLARSMAAWRKLTSSE
jgi:sugar phosphate isomerase/epimerase